MRTSLWRRALALAGGMLTVTSFYAIAPNPANAAGPRPLFQLPFPCGESWHLATYFGHDDYDIDMTANSGTTNGRPILASYGGTVSFAGWNDGAGWYVKLNHGGGWESLYLHMIEQPMVRTGQPVSIGQQLGRVGSTGNSSGPHLHHEQLADGNKVESYFNGVRSGITSDGDPSTGPLYIGGPISAPVNVVSQNRCAASMTNRGVGGVVDGTALRVFARGNDGALWQDAWNGSTWTWQQIGGGILDGPSPVMHNGTLRVFARGLDSALWQAYFSNGNWSWQRIGGGIASSPSAVMHGNSLRVFARGNDGALWQYIWDGSVWSWHVVGGGISSAPSAVVYGNTLRVFARGNDGALWQSYWNGSNWVWQDLGGGLSSGPSAVVYDNVLRVFARGNDGALWQDYWNGSTWNWQHLGGGITSSPSAVVYGNVLRVFARGEDGALWQDYWNGTNWIWQDLGGGIS